jgi:cell division cycle 20-like protein 1 (cofactor of APC complex)
MVPPANPSMAYVTSRHHRVEEAPGTPSAAHYSPISSHGMPLKSILTPATMSSSGSSLPSPIDASYAVNDSMTSCESESSESSVWVPMPSPCRPRLDPRYAMRLAPDMVTPRAASDSELMPPPGIPRNNNSGVFRPSPILSAAPQETYHPTTARNDWPQKQSSSSFKRSAADVGVSDRFIPNRATSNFAVDLWESRRKRETPPAPSPNQEDRDEAAPNNAANPSTTSAQSHQTLLNSLLRSELLGQNENQNQSPAPKSNFLRYQSPRQMYQSNIFDTIDPTLSVVNSFNLTPAGSAASQRLMATPPKRKRRISKVPFKVLDAPALQDDFYLNLVDWSSQNVLAVGLASCVYLWSACTSKVTKLCDLSGDGNSADDLVTSVSWAQRGTHLAIGTNRGQIQLWDAIKCKKVRDMSGHHARVGTLAWSGHTLASGSRDRLVYLRDVRASGDYTDRLNHHKQEVCGLKWSFDEPAFLASGGNDNHLHVIDGRNPTQPLHKFSEHSAAVKAIAWSPHQHGLLASGGGTADRCIRFWNALSGTALSKVDTGSQVCNLAWSQNCNEIVSTHGYSLNQIVVWKYPSMTKVATLTGHTYRVLYLAMSPDGSTVVTGAGDETLRFWQIFPGPRSDGKDGAGGLLFPNTLGSVIR